jgi:hypothetical protein
MRNPSHGINAVALLMAVLLLFTLQGCNSGTSDSVSWGGPDSGTTTTTGYAVSGKIISPVTLLPLPGMKCTLVGTSGTGAFSTITDAQGAYSFAGVPAGNYRLTTSRDGHITDTTYITVAQDYTVNLTSLRKDEWNTVMGADHPYDATKAYVTALVDHTGGGTPPVQGVASSKEPGKEGVVVDLFSNSGGKGSGYESRCYFNVQGKADWNATATSSTGVALFYKTLASDTYTMKAAKEAHTFNDITNVTPINGEFTNYLMNARDTTGVKINIVNNSGYDDKDVYMTVTGKGYTTQGERRCCYYDKDAATMKEFTSSVPESTYAIPLNSLSRATDEASAYTFNLPTESTKSSRTYFSVSKALKFITSSDGSSLGDPNPSSQTDQNRTTLYDWIETSCDSSMFWPNSTTVDFYNMGLLAELYRTEPDPYDHNKDYWAVGFDSPRTDVITALRAMPAAFTEGVMSDGATVYRVLSPKELSTSSSSKLYSYMDDTIKSGWAYYAGSTNPLTIQSGGYTFEKQDSSTATNLVFKCSSPDKTYSIALPKSYEVFQCASGPLKNGTGDQAEDRLHAVVSAALNRGVFTTYSTWGTTTSYYTKNDGNNGYYNDYSNVLHKYAKDKKCYGFPYDDIYDQSSSLPGMEYAKVKKFRITLPKMK